MIKKILIVCFVFTILILYSCSFSGEEKEASSRIVQLINEEEYQKAIIEINEYNRNKVFVLREHDYYYSVCYNKLKLHRLASKYANAYLKYENNTRGIYESAVASFGTADYDKAIAQFHDIEADYVESAEFYNFFGKSYYANECYEEAVDKFKVAMELSPQEYKYCRDLLEVYITIEQYQNGIDLISQFLAVSDKEEGNDSYEHEMLLDQRAELYYRAAQYEESLKEYFAILEKTEYPDYEYYCIAKCYAMLGDYDGVLEYLAKNLEYDSYFYYEDYKYDEVFNQFFEDEEYSKLIQLVEEEYPY